MTWVIQIPDGPKVESDDFTLDDLDKIEKQTGTFWSVMNPLRESKVARAFLQTAYTHAGLDPADVDNLTMKTLKSMFDFVPDGEVLDAEERPTKPRKGQPRRSSSGGAPSDSNGPPVSQDNNVSAISSAS